MVIGSRLVHQPDATVIKRGRHLCGLLVSSKNAFASPHCEVRVNEAFLVIIMRVQAIIVRCSSHILSL